MQYKEFIKAVHTSEINIRPRNLVYSEDQLYVAQTSKKKSLKVNCWVG